VKKYKDIAGDGGSNIAGQVEAQRAKLKARLASVRCTWERGGGDHARRDC